jgi:hypothetical protein
MISCLQLLVFGPGVMMIGGGRNDGTDHGVEIKTQENEVKFSGSLPYYNFGTTYYNTDNIQITTFRS